MEYKTKCGNRYRNNNNSISFSSKYRSLPSPQNGARLDDDRSRFAGDVTHDYSNVYECDLKEKLR